jgi:hypothetical protein
LLSRIGRTTLFPWIALLRVLQRQTIKQGRVTAPARVKSISEDAESFPRRLPRDYLNEAGKVVFVPSLARAPFFALKSVLTGAAAPPSKEIAPLFLNLR